MNKNPKNKWVVIAGGPDISKPHWNGRTPCEWELEDEWDRNATYDTKEKAEARAIERRAFTYFLIRVEKYNPRKHIK